MERFGLVESVEGKKIFKKIKRIRSIDNRHAHIHVSKSGQFVNMCYTRIQLTFRTQFKICSCITGRFHHINWIFFNWKLENHVLTKICEYTIEGQCWLFFLWIWYYFNIYKLIWNSSKSEKKYADYRLAVKLCFCSDSKTVQCDSIIFPIFTQAIQTNINGNNK